MIGKQDPTILQCRGPLKVLNGPGCSRFHETRTNRPSDNPVPVAAAWQTWEWGQASWFSMCETLEVVQYNFPPRQRSLQERCLSVSRMRLLS